MKHYGLSLNQLAGLFEKDKSTISRHIKNIFKEGELESKPVVANYATTATDGKTYQVEHYSLDAIISVGYRANSSQATKFRIWATQVLKNHILKGYTFNQKRLQEKGFDEFEKAVALIKKTLDTKELTTDEATGLLKVITDYANSWCLLQIILDSHGKFVTSKYLRRRNHRLTKKLGVVGKEIQ